MLNTTPEKKYFAFDADGTLIHEEYITDHRGNHFNVTEEILNFERMRPILRYMNRHHVLLLATDRARDEHAASNRRDFLTRSLDFFKEQGIHFHNTVGLRPSDIYQYWGEDKVIYASADAIRNESHMNSSPTENLNIKGKNLHILQSLLSVGVYPEPYKSDDNKEERHNINYQHPDLKDKQAIPRQYIYLVDDALGNLRKGWENGYSAIPADTKYSKKLREAKMPRDDSEVKLYQHLQEGKNNYVGVLAKEAGLHDYALALVDKTLEGKKSKLTDDEKDAIDYLYNCYYDQLTEVQRANLHKLAVNEAYNPHLGQLTVDSAFHAVALRLVGQNMKTTVPAKTIKDSDKDAIDYLYNVYYGKLNPVQQMVLMNLATDKMFIQTTRNRKLVKDLTQKLEEHANQLEKGGFLIYAPLPDKANYLRGIIGQIAQIPPYNLDGIQTFTIDISLILSNAIADPNGMLDARSNILMPASIVGPANGSKKVLAECLEIVRQYKDDNYEKTMSITLEPK